MGAITPRGQAAVDSRDARRDALKLQRREAEPAAAARSEVILGSRPGSLSDRQIRPGIAISSDPAVRMRRGVSFPFFRAGRVPRVAIIFCTFGYAATHVVDPEWTFSVRRNGTRSQISIGD